jgi:hypothetical protein
VKNNSTLHTDESFNKAFAVLRGLLDRKNPPHTWTELHAVDLQPAAKRRLS